MFEKLKRCNKSYGERRAAKYKNQLEEKWKPLADCLDLLENNVGEEVDEDTYNAYLDAHILMISLEDDKASPVLAREYTPAFLGIFTVAIIALCGFLVHFGIISTGLFIFFVAMTTLFGVFLQLYVAYAANIFTKVNENLMNNFANRLENILQKENISATVH